MNLIGLNWSNTQTASRASSLNERYCFKIPIKKGYGVQKLIIIWKKEEDEWLRMFKNEWICDRSKNGNPGKGER